MTNWWIESESKSSNNNKKKHDDLKNGRNPNVGNVAGYFIGFCGGTTGDFELKLEYKVSKQGNSGINYRSFEVDETPFVQVHVGQPMKIEYRNIRIKKY